MLELAFFAPFLFFLFVLAVDTGFYSYGLISVESAARVAALYTSTDSTTAADSTSACTYVLAELKGLPNVASTTTCTSNPVTVSATAQNASDGTSASRVTVTYQSSVLIPVPGLMRGQFTWNRSVIMRLRG